MTNYSDIFNSFQKGELTPFYDEMFPGLLRFTAATLGDTLAYMSEDCLQDVILSAYVRRDSFADASHWRSWLLVTIRNRAIELMRKTNSFNHYIENVDTADAQWAGVEAALIEQETMDSFFAAIRNLPTHYREIVELSFEQGLKNEEVGRQLGITEVAVRKRKAKLIEILRQRLGGRLTGDTIILLLNSNLLYTTLS